jgi:uncharacterized protein YnzC (UPF0291/DUF896 family)
MPSKIYLAIWKRLIEPNKGNMSPAAAEGILNWKLGLKDANRMNALAAKAPEKRATEKESQELETYRRVSGFLSLFHMKARLSLKKSKRKNVARRPRA